MAAAEQRIRFIVTGLGDNGKSLYLANTIVHNLEVYKQMWDKQKVKVPRHVALNPKTMKLAPWLEEKYGIWPNGYIEYYNGLHDLHKLEECDVVLDEMSTNFNARRWQDMPQNIIDWFNTLGHRGVFIYGTAQNFLDIDITIRRRTQKIIALTKLMGSPRPCKSLPPVKRVWGVILKRYISYQEIDKEESKRKLDTFSFRPFFITKKRCSYYDTLQTIGKTDYPDYTCYERKCTNPNHVNQRTGEPFKHFMHV